MNLLSVLKNAPLSKPGDYLSARVTKGDKRVLKVCVDGCKRSLTEYPNGTIVETLTRKVMK